MAAIFDANTIPNFRITFYQYCDIHLPQVQEMLDRLEAAGPRCNERRGWLPLGFDAQCRDILTTVVLENYRTVYNRNLAEEEDYEQGEGDDEDNPENIYDEFEETGLDDTEQDMMDIDEECQ
jgi:general transcription factor 3C polypeptide 5 (transcription factor C subunit 1)